MNVVIINALQIIVKGGPMMWPILLLSIISTAIVIERLIFLRKAEKTLIQQREILMQSLRKGEIKEALKLCESHAGPIPMVMKTALLHFSSSTELIKLSMQEVGERQKLFVRGSLPILGMIINIAPLLGLLGTVNSMTVVFHASVVRSNVLNPVSAGELATGVWQALLTTTGGLVVGIFSYVLYSFINARVLVYFTWLEQWMAEVLYVISSLKEMKQTGSQDEYER